MLRNPTVLAVAVMRAAFCGTPANQSRTAAIRTGLFASGLAWATLARTAGQGSTADNGGKPFGDPSVTIGFNVTYEPWDPHGCSRQHDHAGIIRTADT